jgi:hypothetical protein
MSKTLTEGLFGLTVGSFLFISAQPELMAQVTDYPIFKEAVLTQSSAAAPSLPIPQPAGFWMPVSS